MAEVKTYVFSYKEVAEALIKKQEIHEGLWAIYMEFGIAGANIQAGEEGLAVPAAIVPVLKVGIQRSDTATLLTVDAAEVNPQVINSTKATSRNQKIRRGRVKA